MNAVAYRVISSIPSIIFFVIEAFISICPAIFPDKFAKWLSWLITPEQFRLIGISGIALFFAWLALLLFLKPREMGEAVPGQNKNSFNESNVFYGPVTFLKQMKNEIEAEKNSSEEGNNNKVNQFENMPQMAGFTAHMVLKLGYKESSSRTFILTAQDANGVSMQAYFAPGDSFTLCATDRHGSEHSMPIPFNRNGVPIAQMIDLSLAVGSDFKRTVIRVGVNGSVIAQRIVPVPIGPFKDPWRHEIGKSLTTDGRMTAGDGAPFDLYEAAMWHFFIGNNEEKSISKALIENWQIEA